jgi:hypothetical protein
MPLRDHFRPPVSKRGSWQGFHGGWPMAMVQRLAPLLPPEYTAEPRAQLGRFYEVDVDAFEDDEPKANGFLSRRNGNGTATATAVVPEPTLILDADLGDQYEYEVLIYDPDQARRLVAAVEIVSPANKDRPETRRAFVSKCAALLQQGVCVSIVDLVTTRNFNLYTDRLALIDKSDPAFSPNPPSIYAVTIRSRKAEPQAKLDLWAHPLAVGQPLPQLPIWLTEDQRVMLDLEASYEDTCRVLRIA